MAVTSLRSYLSRIEQIVDDDRVDEAVVHCRRILEQHPRHLDTYRLLASILLKSEQYEDAEDIFQRVLSADPEDLGAHIGLAEVYQKTERPRFALRHLQAAFDLSPYDEGVRRRLAEAVAGQQNGGPRRLMLTPEALARIQVKGAQYPQALAFLQAASPSERGRPDLQLLLAEALRHDDRRVEAVEVCRQLLTQLPACVRANAILASCYLAMEQKDEARVCLQQMQTVLLWEKDHAPELEDDPVNVLLQARELISLPEQITVHTLEIRERQLTGNTGEADWMSRMHLEDITPPGKPEELLSESPVWLSTFESLQADMVAEEAPETVAMPTEQGPETADVAAAVAAIALAARRREAGDGTSGTEETTMSGTDEHSEFPSEAEDAPDAPDELKATLAWLEELAAKQGVPLQDLPLLHDSGTGRADDAYPDWLTGDMAEVPTGAETFAASSLAETDPASSEEVPDWLRESVEETPAFEIETGAAAGEEDQFAELGWLDQIAAGAGAAIDEPPTLSWQKAGESSSPGAEDDALSWLDNLVVPTAAEADAQVGVEEPWDWSAGEQDDNADAESLAASEGAVGGVDGHDDEVHSAMREAQEVPEDLDEAMAWLEQLAARQGAPLEELPSIEQRSESAVLQPSIPEADDAEMASRPDIGDVPDDLEEAMVWAAGTAAVGTVRDDDRPAGPGETPPAYTAMSIEEIPEDPDDVLNWLELLAAKEIATYAGAERAEDFSVVDEPVTPAVPHDVVAAVAAAEAKGLPVTAPLEAASIEPESVESLVDAIPDDPDAAMAWLEQLAARQGAMVDEVPLAEQTEDDTDIPAAALLDDAPEEADAATEPTETEQGDGTDLPLTAEEALAEELPEWLALELAEAPEQMPAEWATEEVKTEDPPAESEEEEADSALPLTTDASEGTVEAIPDYDLKAWDEAETMIFARTEPSPVTGVETAAALEAGPETGAELSHLISELEQVPDEAEDFLDSRARLGDAYVRAGDLEKALEAYGSALDRL